MVPIISIAYLLLLTSAQTISASGHLITERENVAVQVGEDAEFTCIWEEGGNSTKLEVLSWYFLTTSTTGEGKTTEVERQVVNSSRVHIENGIFEIHNVTLEDVGRYVCRDDSGSEPAEAQLEVYEMPDYWEEGVVLVAMAAVLLLVLIVLVVQRNRMQKKSLRERKKNRGSRPISSLVEVKQR